MIIITFSSVGSTIIKYLNLKVAVRPNIWKLSLFIEGSQIRYGFSESRHSKRNEIQKKKEDTRIKSRFSSRSFMILKRLRSDCRKDLFYQTQIDDKYDKL